MTVDAGALIDDLSWWAADRLGRDAAEQLDGDLARLSVAASGVAVDAPVLHDRAAERALRCWVPEVLRGEDGFAVRAAAFAELPWPADPGRLAWAERECAALIDSALRLPGERGERLVPVLRSGQWEADAVALGAEDFDVIWQEQLFDALLAFGHLTGMHRVAPELHRLLTGAAPAG